MTTALTTIDITVRDIAGEPRVLDLDLAKALGMAQPEDIRRTIKAHRTELEEFGFIADRPINAGQRGRPGTEFYLNEEQATYVTMHLRTPKAQAVKVQLVRVFTAWRRGQLQPAQPALPDFSDQVASARAWADAKEREQLAEARAKIATAEVARLAPVAAVGELVCSHETTLMRFVQSVLPAVNSQRIHGWLLSEGHLRKSGGTYAVYARSKHLFDTRRTNKDGRIQVIVKDKGKQYLAAAHARDELPVSWPRYAS